jgi:biopolymer transport protein ExbD
MRSLALFVPFVVLLACKEAPTTATITCDPAPSCSCSCPSPASATVATTKPTTAFPPLDLSPSADPFAPSLGVLAEPSPLLVAIDAHGEVTVDGTTAPDDKAFLALIAARDAPPPRAEIFADASVPHGKVIHVLDLLRTAGIERIAFGVTKSP